MKAKHWFTVAAAALALGLMASTSEAAPAGGGILGLKDTGAETSAVDQVRWRRHCWWHRGHLHCRRHWVPYYGYYYGGPYYGPSIGLYFGGRRHHHHHHRRWR